MVKAAFRKVALRLHHDKNTGCTVLANSRFAKAARARDSLLREAPREATAAAGSLIVSQQEQHLMQPLMVWFIRLVRFGVLCVRRTVGL